MTLLYFYYYSAVREGGGGVCRVHFWVSMSTYRLYMYHVVFDVKISEQNVSKILDLRFVCRRFEIRQ